ncbi:MAG: CapA family protein [Clostridiales bacterium]|nr:CapA family protein [Clostridiales bacterium]
MQNDMSFVATGDSFITRRLPSKDKSFQEVSSIIKGAEFRFTNLEVTVHKDEGVPYAFSGGTWAKAEPKVLEDIKDYGFNALNIANNHTLDYSSQGLEATQRYLEEYDLFYAGAGKNLAEASRPKYLDCPSGRVAFIAATSSFYASWIAGEQRPEVKGRPGINPLRYETVHYLSEERFQQLKNISQVTGINDARVVSQREGFTLPDPDNVFIFGGHKFSKSEREGLETYPNKTDLNRMINSIGEAKRQADYIIISIHAHPFAGLDKEIPAKFLESFSRACIDAGAHAVLGHGPHILRGIEIYKGRPIFYSLGNFIFQSETVPYLPWDFYEKYGLGFTDNVADALDIRTENDTRGLGADPKVWESVIARWDMKDGIMKRLELYPIEMGYGDPRYKRGWPRLSNNTDILYRLRELSANYGTEIHIEGLNGIINIS